MCHLECRKPGKEKSHSPGGLVVTEYTEKDGNLTERREGGNGSVIRVLVPKSFFPNLVSELLGLPLFSTNSEYKAKKEQNGFFPTMSSQFTVH